MTQIFEVLRRWLSGIEGYRRIADVVGIDRKTARRYIETAVGFGLTREKGIEQLTDELIGKICEKIRPTRPNGHGTSWALLEQQHKQISEWVASGLTYPKVGDLLRRKGISVPQRTLQRYCAECCNKKDTTTVRVNDPEPGIELQMDFGQLGYIVDPTTKKKRVVYGLIFVCVFSRDMFVWLTHRQTTNEVIKGCEKAWEYFGGVFPIIIPDNLTPVVTKADSLSPKFNQIFLEYSQARGFLIEPTRVRKPKDKPRVERQVPYVRRSFFQGEKFLDLSHAQRCADSWCNEKAGLRIHGTTRQKPREVFLAKEQPLLLQAPKDDFDLPIFLTVKVHRDSHVQVEKALYSVPGDYIGKTLKVRADKTCVKLFQNGRLIRIHPKVEPGKRSSFEQDIDQYKRIYATRDLDGLVKKAQSHGNFIGAVGSKILDDPLPWSKMRQVYALISLTTKFGDRLVDQACEKVLEFDHINIKTIEQLVKQSSQSNVLEIKSTTRFMRDPSEFIVMGSNI